jgi:hypothetical protein
MDKPNLRGYRHAAGLFPPIRTAFDYCPVPHFVRFSDTNRMVRVGVDGVEYPDYGGADLTRELCEQYVTSGDFVRFDPDNVADWLCVVAGAIGSPALIDSNDREWPLLPAWREAWQPLAAAREREIEALDPMDEHPQLPSFVQAAHGLFEDGDHGPYYGELRGDEFLAHHLSGEVTSLGTYGWNAYVRRHLRSGSMKPFDPSTLKELESA